MNTTLPPPQIPSEQHVATAPPAGHRANAEYVRPRLGRRIGGVCAAIADRHGWSRTTVRLVAALSVLLPGPQVIAYVIAWIVMPSDDEVTASVPSS
jgi:phage shock protein PspC (stress-responsive transcriptional regulator)